MLGSAAALASVGAIKAPAKAAQFTLRAASSHPLAFPSTVRMRQMWAQIEKESGGRLHVDFFPASVLGNDSSMFSQMRGGAINVLLLTMASLAAVVPVSDMGFLGFAYKDPAEAARVIDGPLGDYIRREVTAKGMHALTSAWDTGMNQIGSNTHPIKVPEDLKGFKIRVQDGRITLSLFRALEASPVPLSLNEIYTALQTKLIDGEGAAIISIDQLRFFEVNKYISLVNYAWAGTLNVVNGDTWKSLPPDIQEIIERNNTKYCKMERRDLYQLDLSTREKLSREGSILNTVDQSLFHAKLKTYYQTWAKEFGDVPWGLLESALGHKLT